jgi:hypothetical protein
MLAGMLREDALLEFLAGRIGAWRLRRELGDVLDHDEAPARTEAASAPFELFPRHLLALCEAVLARELEPPLLPLVARWLHGSARFRVTGRDPDGRVVEEVLVAWSAGELRLHHPDDVTPFRDWLVTRRRPQPL